MSSTLLFSTLALLGIIAIIVVHIDSAGKENSASALKVFKFNKDLQQQQQQQQHRYLKQPVLVFEEEDGPPCSMIRCADPCANVFCAAIDVCEVCTKGQGCTATCFDGNKVCAGYRCTTKSPAAIV
jgi:hypothetical protein